MTVQVRESLPDAPAHTASACRLCGGALERTFVDLGMSPLCERFLAAEQLDVMEPYFPLHVLVCQTCFLVQLREYVSPDPSSGNMPIFPPIRPPGSPTPRRTAR